MENLETGENNELQEKKDLPNYIKHKKTLVKYFMDQINNSKIPHHIWLLIIKSLYLYSCSCI